MAIPEYFASVAEELRRQSDRVRFNFATHRPSAGDNRESIVAEFLRSHLPQSVGVSTGLVLSSDGIFSQQADVLITDVLTNAPLYSTMPEQLWLAESVYAIIEVKTNLSPREIADSIEKCRRFKSLARSFSPLPASPKISDSLFITWAFEAPSPETVKDNYAEAIRDIPREEQPDFVVVPDSLVIKSGNYYSLAKLGQKGSAHRRALEAEHGDNVDALLGDGFDLWHLGDSALMVWFAWLNSWLTDAGTRTATVLSYIPEGKWGRVV